jgi:enoyl-CoA hydratase
MADSLLRLEREAEVATLLLNRPEKRNALNAQLRDEITAALEELEAEPGVSVVIVRAAGPVFCAGFDTSEFAETSPSQVFASASSRRYHYRLQHFRKPIIAAVNGPAMGGGFDLAVLCDVRLVADTATFGHPEIKFGATPLYGPLAAIIGGGVARDLCLTGRRIDAHEALRIGLVSKVVTGEQLVAEATEFASRIAEAPLAALQAVKWSILRATAWKFERDGD